MFPFRDPPSKLCTRASKSFATPLGFYTFILTFFISSFIDSSSLLGPYFNTCFNKKDAITSQHFTFMSAKKGTSFNTRKTANMNYLPRRERSNHFNCFVFEVVSLVVTRWKHYYGVVSYKAIPTVPRNPKKYCQHQELWQWPCMPRPLDFEQDHLYTHKPIQYPSRVISHLSGSNEARATMFVVFFRFLWSLNSITHELTLLFLHGTLYIKISWLLDFSFICFQWS